MTSNPKLPAQWEKQARAQKRVYERLLIKGNKNKILEALPELHNQAFSQVDCLQCARCCKNYSPRFKQPDIKRIAKVLGWKEGELVQRYLKLDADNDYVLQQSPCPFLEDDNSCRIYENRPSDCRRYPYTDEDVLVKRVQLTLKNAEVCPAVFVVLEQLNNLITRK